MNIVFRVYRQFYKGRFYIAQIAQAVGIGESTLRRRISREGIRFCDLLMRYRRRVVSRLEGKNLPAKTVMNSAGFTYENSFVRFIHQELGIGYRDYKRGENGISST